MPLTTAGINWFATALMNSGPPTFFDNGHAYIGVGDSSSAFAIGQTDLQGSNKVRVGMDATYPSVATATVTFQATFGSAVANWAWAEWAVFNASSSGTMVSRKVESNGTKSSGQSWVFQVQLALQIGS